MQKYFNIASLATCIALAFFLFKSCQKNEDSEQFKKMYAASQDSLRTYVTKDGLHAAEINVLSGSVSNLKSLIAGTDSALRRLQKIVDKNTTSATILLSATHNIGSSHTQILPGDTIRKDSLVYVYPNYITTWNEKWSKGKITATKDSVFRDFITYNDFELKQEWEKQKVEGKWFRQKVLVSSVVNKNPATETINMKSFALEAPKKHKLLTYAAGFATGIATTIYLNNKLKK